MKLPRFTSDNPIAVKENNGKPYSTGWYETHIKRNECCGKDPDLFSHTRTKTFLKEAIYLFKCEDCGKEGNEGITPNGASCGWNETF